MCTDLEINGHLMSKKKKKKKGRLSDAGSGPTVVIELCYLFYVRKGYNYMYT